VTVPDVNVVQVIVPAISPIYGNNPGYGILEIDDNTFEIDTMHFHWFQLEDWYRMGVAIWKDLDIQGQLGYDLNDPSSVRDINNKMMYNFQQFGLMQAMKYGVPKYLAQGAAFFWPLYQLFDNNQTPEGFGVICSNTAWDASSMSEACQSALGLI